jgi:hypothetical protein
MTAMPTGCQILTCRCLPRQGKICGALIAAAVLASATGAWAQQRTIYGNDGRVVGRYTTDTQGTTTLYGANGRVISRATGNTTIIHDGVSGRVVGSGKTKQEKR